MTIVKGMLYRKLAIAVVALTMIALATYCIFQISGAQEYTLGTDLSFQRNSATANSYFWGNIGSAEESATWFKDRANGRFKLPAASVGKELLLHLEWAAVDTHPQTMIIRIGDTLLYQKKFDAAGETEIVIPEQVNTSREVDLEFEFPDACPSSFAFSAMRISENRAKDYTLGTRLRFLQSDPTANDYFLSGLREAETSATWAMENAIARFSLAKSDVGKELLLHLEWAAVDTHAQTMIVRCSGRELLRQTFLTETEVDVIIPASWNTEETLQLDFEFPDACPSSFAFTEMWISAD